MSTVQFAELGGRRMAFVECGKGDPVLLVHGALSDYRYWAPQMEPLGCYWRTVAVSLRGHFPEPLGPGSAAGYTATAHAQDLVRFIHMQRCGPVHLVGHSRGALVAALSALTAPDCIRSLVLADPALGGSASLRDAQAMALAQIRAGNVAAGLQAFIDTVSGPGVWKKLNDRRRQMALDNAQALAAQFEDRPPRLDGHALASTGVPVLLVGGEKSPPPYPANLDLLGAAIPTAKRVTIDRVSHAMTAEDPATFNRELTAFLRDRS